MFKNILIIGFGMIGSSIARTVLKKNKNIKIFAFDKSPYLKIRINKSKLKRVKVLKSLNEIKEVLTQMGLHLGMEVVDWPPDDIEDMAKKLEEPF